MRDSTMVLQMRKQMFQEVALLLFGYHAHQHRARAGLRSALLL